MSYLLKPGPVSVRYVRTEPVVSFAASDPTYTLSTVSNCAFPVAGNRLRNSLLSDVTSSPTLTVFQNRRNFPDHCLSGCFLFLVCAPCTLVVEQCFTSATLNNSNVVT